LKEGIMASAVQSLWPPEIKPDILSPKLILRTQANALSAQTKGVLVGELSEGKTTPDRIVLNLDMVAPAIKYRHRVLTATYSLHRLYPVLVDADVFRHKGLTAIAMSSALSDALAGKKPEGRADSDEELVTLVAKVLSSPEVVSMAQSLIALANEATTPTNFVQHLKALAESDRRSAIDEKIADTYHEILNSEAFNGAIAETNATGWGVDDYEIQDIDLGDENCIVKLSYSASGEQDTDKVYAGDTVTGTAEAAIDAQGAVQYSNITAEVVLDDAEPDSEEGPGEGPGSPS
jgi:hypothetical protein